MPLPRMDADLVTTTARSVGVAVILAALLLVAVEAALQARSQLRTGTSAFSALTGRSTFVRDSELGIRLLRPGSVVRGQRLRMQANRYGLRGPEFELESPVDEVRIAILGASTIMGTYAVEDSRTSSAQLQAVLEGRLGAGKVRVINAGVAGLTVGNQAILLRERLLQMNLDVVIWYPGTNDLGCSTGAAERVTARFGTPNWLLTGDLLLKNTQPIRRSGTPARSNLAPVVDLGGIASALREGIQAAKDANVGVLIVLPARSFSVDMSTREIERRAAETLVFRPCFTARGLAEASRHFDDMLRSVAIAEHVPVVDAGVAIGFDEVWYGDALHFSESGETKFADVLFEALVSNRMLSERRIQ